MLFDQACDGYALFLRERIGNKYSGKVIEQKLFIFFGINEIE